MLEYAFILHDKPENLRLWDHLQWEEETEKQGGKVAEEEVEEENVFCTGELFQSIHEGSSCHCQEPRPQHGGPHTLLASESSGRLV